ncbi:hypothetical protein [Pseudonocardia sp.]|uniref:hypothetical protein n=1 Tax=Pseudonocardia sp. TaxID=60912 RepID=UPI002612332B|nr:hypothetical protein [Pseudonocardia sp.]MCW2722482.1 hypothetical protein [Pseudonocardia sp.]
MPAGIPVAFCTDSGLDAFRFSDVPAAPGPGASLLAIRCYQPDCADEGPIGAVWCEANGLWGADTSGRGSPSQHLRPLDAARWVRARHDAHRHTESRWTAPHLDVASAADVAAAHTLTTGG